MMESSKKAMNKDKESKEKNIQVFVRVRPLNSIERNAKSYSVVNCQSSREITIKEKLNDKITKTFAFDRVFAPDSKQVDVYKNVVDPLIEEVLAGYNCTVFAYGQTGTGKSFTMEGEKSGDPSISWQDDPLSGIVPRAMNHLFDELRVSGNAEYTVRVSFLEIYNEELIDLLSPSEDMTKLRLYEDSARKGSVIIQGLEEKSVHNKDQVYKILEQGSQKRQTAATLMNAHSSRSHTIFTITIHIKDNAVDGEELLKTGKLNLVDLAGSENIGRSGAQDKRAREAGNINQSLLTLGRCITALVERTPHVPYRESKLTRLLQDSLGGRTKTSIIATISPALSNLEETLSTLDYAHRAKNITNRPEINQKMSKKALIREYTEEIEKLRRDLQAAREKNGVFLAAENYDKMVADLEYMQSELTVKINAIKNLEAVLEELKFKSTQEIEEKTEQLKVAKEKMVDVVYEKKEMDFIINRQVETEEKLSEQAQQLKTLVEETTYDIKKLQDTLDRKRKIESYNTTNVNDVYKKIAQSSSFFSNFSSDQTEELKSKVEKFRLHNDDNHTKEKHFIDDLQNKVTDLDNLVDNIVTCTGQNLTRTKTENDNLIQTLLDRLKTKTTNYESFCLRVIQGFQKISKSIVQNDLAKFISNQEELQDKLTEFKENMVKMESDCAQIEAVLNQSKNETIEQIESIEDLLTEIKEHEAEMDMQQENQNQIIETLSNNNQEQFQLLEMLQEKHLKMQQDISKLKEGEKIKESKRRDIKDVVTDLSNNFVQLKDGVSSRSEEVKTRLQENTFKKTQNILGLLDLTAQQSQEKNTATVEEVNNNVEGLSSHFDGVINESKQMFGDQISATQEQCNILKKSIETHVDELNQLTVDGIGKGVKGRSAILSETVQQHLVDYIKDKNSFADEITETQNDLVKFQTILAEHHKCPDILKGFVESQYRPDLPSGETPPRKDFKCPSRFAATSPHERLIQRFRLTVPRSQFILNEENFEVEQIDSENDSSNGSESVVSSDLGDRKLRRSLSVNDLSSEGDRASISPACSDIQVMKKTTKRNLKENRPVYRNKGKIPISKSNSGDNIIRSNTRSVLSEKN